MREIKANITKKPDHWLRVVQDKKSGEIHIEGNKPGLEYLASVCFAISAMGQKPGANHWHLSEIFYTLEKGSPDLIVCFQEAITNK